MCLAGVAMVQRENILPTLPVKIGILQETPASVGLLTGPNQRAGQCLHPGSPTMPCELAAEYVIDLPQGSRSLANIGLLFNVRIKDIDVMPALRTRLRAADSTSVFIFSSASCLVP